MRRICPLSGAVSCEFPRLLSEDSLSPASEDSFKSHNPVFDSVSEISRTLLVMIASRPASACIFWERAFGSFYGVFQINLLQHILAYRSNSHTFLPLILSPLRMSEVSDTSQMGLKASLCQLVSTLVQNRWLLQAAGPDVTGRDRASFVDEEYWECLLLAS